MWQSGWHWLHKMIQSQLKNFCPNFIWTWSTVFFQLFNLDPNFLFCNFNIVELTSCLWLQCWHRFNVFLCKYTSKEFVQLFSHGRFFIY